MSNKIIPPTAEQIHMAYIAYLQKTRKAEPEVFARFTEVEMAEFIRKHIDANFDGIYERTDHNYYDRIRDRIATNPVMRTEDSEADLKYSVHLRTYSEFLDSKFLKDLFKQKMMINMNTPSSTTSTPAESPKTPSTPKERDMTEGEKKHVEYETAHRNPALRQACIDKYGYQCQCCGMDFTSLYGEELGARFIEVHHLKMISTYDESRPADYIENLVPLCSNCHAMIHHGKDGPLTLGELRQAYKGEKKELKICKED